MLEKDITRCDTKVESIRESSPDAETTEPNNTFEISDNALESINLITEIEADVPEWIELSKENQWVINAVRLFFAF